MSDRTDERERQIIVDLEDALNAMKGSSRPDTRQYGADLEARKNAGTFLKLARLIVHIEDIFEGQKQAEQAPRTPKDLTAAVSNRRRV